MASDKKYWKSVEELTNSSFVETLSKNEFVQEIPTDTFLGDKETLANSSTSRRDFLKYVGFTTAAATLAACALPIPLRTARLKATRFSNCSTIKSPINSTSASGFLI